LATINREGWLMSVTVDTPGTVRSAFSAVDAVARVTASLGRTPQRVARAFANGNASPIASEFHPFWQVDTDGGRTFVDERGDVFVSDPTALRVIAGRSGLEGFRRVNR
jgi:hypothetical protein